MMLHEAVAASLQSAWSSLNYDEESPDGNVFVDHLAPLPDRCVAVYTRPSGESDSKLPFDYANFQVVTRCEAGSRWALEAMERVYSWLHGKRNTELMSVQLVYALALQATPVRLTDDEAGRLRYSIDFRAEVARPTAERSAL